MITRLQLRNFKAWEHLENIRLAPLTGFFGTNSSGKTSILQALLLMKQTAASPDRRVALDFGGESSPVELGTFLDTVFAHGEERAIEFGLGWTLAKALTVANPLEPESDLLTGDALQFDASVSLRDGQPATDSITYEIDDVSFSLTRHGTGKSFRLSVAPTGVVEFQKRVGRPSAVTGPVRFYGFPAEAVGNYTNAEFLNDLELQLEQLLAEVSYLGPLREDPHRQYTWGGARPADVGQRGEKAVEAILAARAGKLHVPQRGRGKVTVEKWVARWLQDLGLIESFDVVPVVRGSSLYQVKVRRSGDSPEVLLTDVGFGVSQVLPVLVLLAYAPEGSVILLEQPEIHLHPAVQAGLADVILDAIDKRKVQVIVESHSEHFLQRLQRRVAEQEAAPADVALYFSHQSEGRAVLDELQLDIFGNIGNWPDGFFGDPLGDAVAMTRAAARRQGVA